VAPAAALQIPALRSQVREDAIDLSVRTAPPLCFAGSNPFRLFHFVAKCFGRAGSRAFEPIEAQGDLASLATKRQPVRPAAAVWTPTRLLRFERIRLNILPERRRNRLKAKKCPF
jgi:hypothetical protein